MQTITDPKSMQQWSDSVRAEGGKIGLVPTMGYLHEGHLSLVREAKRRSDHVIASIFVNPLQFGANEDLGAYPRNLDNDCRLLDGEGTEILFSPEASSMYPEGYQTTVSVKDVTQGLCGKARPTHFLGVTTVVAKLFNSVKPHVAIFGRKDFQQFVAIRRMVTDLNMDVEVIGAPIVREADGLTMSSRNKYLDAGHRRAALCLSRSLGLARDAVVNGERNAQVIRSLAKRIIENEELADLDYVELVHPETMREVESIDSTALLAVAAQFGPARLIDNCLLGEGQETKAPK